MNLITEPTRIQATGEPPKVIEDFIGRVNSGTEQLIGLVILDLLLKRYACR